MKDMVGQLKARGSGLVLVLLEEKKVSFYGVYIYNQGATRIFPYELAEKMNTIDVPEKVTSRISQTENYCCLGRRTLS